MLPVPAGGPVVCFFFLLHAGGWRLAGLLLGLSFLFWLPGLQIGCLRRSNYGLVLRTRLFTMFITESDMKTLAKTHNKIFVFFSRQKMLPGTNFPQHLLARPSRRTPELSRARRRSPSNGTGACIPACWSRRASTL